MVQTLDPKVPAYDAQTIEAFYAARVTSIGTVMTRLIAGMGLMGVSLTMVGLYGLVGVHGEPADARDWHSRRDRGDLRPRPAHDPRAGPAAGSGRPGRSASR